MSAALPPLPEMGYLGDDASYGYDAFDMKAYAQQARADLEAENKRLREALATLSNHLSVSLDISGMSRLVLSKIAQAALKEQP